MSISWKHYTHRISGAPFDSLLRLARMVAARQLRRVVLTGPGKTNSAAVLAGLTGLPVHRVDLGTIDSRYIGETEKNLDAVFKRAEGREVVLFFDEADALFGRRTRASRTSGRAATGSRKTTDRIRNLFLRYRGRVLLRFLEPGLAERVSRELKAHLVCFNREADCASAHVGARTAPGVNL